MTTMIVTKNLKLTKILFIFIGLLNVLHANSVNFTFKEGHKVAGKFSKLPGNQDLPLVLPLTYHILTLEVIGIVLKSCCWRGILFLDYTRKYKC